MICNKKRMASSRRCSSDVTEIRPDDEQKR